MRLALHGRIAGQMRCKYPHIFSAIRLHAGGMVEIFLFIIVAGVIAHFIGASVHEGIFVGALVSSLKLLTCFAHTICVHL